MRKLSLALAMSAGLLASGVAAVLFSPSSNLMNVCCFPDAGVIVWLEEDQAACFDALARCYVCRRVQICEGGVNCESGSSVRR